MPEQLASGQVQRNKTRVILVGLGGASCSGKTTLAKHLKHILPNSVIIHQDDFAPPQDDSFPIHPVYSCQDWDSAPGAILWLKLISTLQDIKRTGAIPPDYISHDHMNEQRDVPVLDEVSSKWKKVFSDLMKQKSNDGEDIIWGLVDGFLLYWHKDVIDQLDVRFFLRVPHDVLKSRRDERSGYYTAGDGAEGTMWQDPPYYWSGVAYPAYVEAHRDIFENGNVVNGNLNGKVKGLILFEGTDITMSDMVERSCSELVAHV